MRKNIRLIMLFVFVSGLFGCATPRMNLSTPDDAVITPEKDMALVYFIRPNKLGYAIHAAVYDDDNFIGFVPYNQKLPYMAQPGEHMFMVVSEAADFIKADLLAGRTYYVQVVPRMGAWRARFSLDPVTKDELDFIGVQKWIKESVLIKNNDAAYQWAKDNHESVLKKKTAYFPKWQQKPEDKKPFLRAEDSM